MVASVGSDRIVNCGSDLPILTDCEPYGWWKALTGWIIGLAFHNHRDDSRRSAHSLEEADFFVDVLASCRIWRANNQEEFRGLDGAKCGFPKRGAASKIISISKYGSKCSRNFAGRSFSTNEVTTNAICF